MATSPLDPADISLRDFIEAVGSADAPHGAVSTAAVAGGFTILLYGLMAHIVGVPFVNAEFYQAFGAGLLLLFGAHVIGNWPTRKGPRWNGYRWS